MRTEYHCHVLPALDDGSENMEMSVSMLQSMKEQGVERVVFTPHFYAHSEKSVEVFLERRQAAFDQLKAASPISEMLLGAEVAVEHGLSEIQDIEKLAIQGTNLILLELPYRAFKDWMLEEIYQISVEHHLKVMLAHVHRYLEYYNQEQMERLLEVNAVFQVNIEAFGRFSDRRFVKKMLKEDYPVVFGSDAHNLSSRKPNWDLLSQKCKIDAIEASDSQLEKFKI